MMGVDKAMRFPRYEYDVAMESDKAKLTNNGDRAFFDHDRK